MMKNKSMKNQGFFQTDFFPKSRRGDIPVTILVIGVFAVATLAILSFIYSSFVLSKSFVPLDLMEKANIEIERGNLQNYFDDYNVNYVSPEFGIHWIKEKTIFSLQYTANP